MENTKPPIRKSLKIAFGIIVVFFVLVVVLVSGDKEPKTGEPSPSSEPYAYKTAENTLARQIEQKVVEVLGSETNLKKPRVVGVDVEKYNAVELRDYGYKADAEVLGVTVKINASENITTNLQKSTLHKEAFGVLKNTFPLSPQIGDVLVWAYLPVKDKFGNTKDDVAITYHMARSLFEKVSWDGLNYDRLPDLLKTEVKSDLRNGYHELIKF